MRFFRRRPVGATSKRVKCDKCFGRGKYGCYDPMASLETIRRWVTITCPGCSGKGYVSGAELAEQEKYAAFWHNPELMSAEPTEVWDQLPAQIRLDLIRHGIITYDADGRPVRLKARVDLDNAVQ